MAARSRAELVGVHIRSEDGLARQSGGVLEKHRLLLKELGGRYEEITAGDVPKALVEFARSENATQLVLGATQRSRWAELLHGSVINQVIREAAGAIDVHVISSRPDQKDGEERNLTLPPLRARGRLATLPRRRILAGWTLGIVGMPLLALALAPLRSTLGVTGSLPLLLLGTIVAAGVGGLLPGLAAALIGFGLADWFFIPPYHTWTIAHASDAVAGVTFVIASGIVSVLVDNLSRRRLEVARARGESEALARLAGGALLSKPEALPQMVSEILKTFGVDAVAVLVPSESDGRSGRWQVQASAGSPVPQSPDDGQFSTELGDGAVLVLSGTQLAAEDRPLLSAFIAQLRLAKEQGRLQARAASADSLAEANELRTALLAAVSHDLRTPLASIKASATSLLSHDVNWSAEDVRSFCQTISSESDRLNALVGNLLDMSRLQTGALTLAVRPVGVEEIAFSALAGLPGAQNVAVEVSEDLPRVSADPALLERAVANLIENALNWTPEDKPVRVEAGLCGDHIDLRVVDRGPGIPPDERERVFQPFQRLGDGGKPSRDGVGLGLAVAKGFVEAMGGELTLDDTPGGGLTTVISLTIAGDGQDAATPPEAEQEKDGVGAASGAAKPPATP
jgi:two-component system sensor histidine kinase KdpD